jgi:hypothetical protein
MREILLRKNLRNFFANYLPALLLSVCAGICQVDLVDESEMITTQWGRSIDPKMATVHGTICKIPPLNSNQ